MYLEGGFVVGVLHIRQFDLSKSNHIQSEELVFFLSSYFSTNWSSIKSEHERSAFSLFLIAHGKKHPEKSSSISNTNCLHPKSQNSEQ